MKLKFNLYNSEIYILANMLVDKAFFARVYKHIKPAYFSDPKHGNIFKYFTMFFERFRRLPNQQTLHTIVKKDSRVRESVDIHLLEVNNLFDEKVRVNIDKSYVEFEVFEFIKKAKVWEAYELAEKDFQNQEFDVGIKRLRDASHITIDRHLGFQFSKPVERYEKMKQLTEQCAVSTGYVQLDNAMEGGFYPKELTIFAGIYGGFKSLFLVNIAANCILSGKKVVLYTLEMSEERYFIRLDSILLQKTKKELFSDTDKTADHIRKICNETGGDIIIKEYPSSTETVETFHYHLDELEEFHDYKPDLVIIDYLGLVRPSTGNSGNGTYIAGKCSAEDLRNLGKIRSVGIVTAHQLNRGAIDEKKGGTKQLVTGGNIADSIAIMHTADNAFMINATAKERAEGVIRLFTDKLRNQKAQQELDFVVDWEYMRVRENLEIDEVTNDLVDEKNVYDPIAIAEAVING